MVYLKNGSLRFKCEEVKALETCECRRSLRVAQSGREPTHAQQLNRMGKSRLAIAEIQANRMDPVSVDNNEIVAESGLAAWA
jgi:hypothetical protein